MSAERMFGGIRTYQALIGKGPIIGLEFAGENCVGCCQQCLQTLTRSTYANIPRQLKWLVWTFLIEWICFVFADFMSQSATDAQTQLEKFYNFASIQMFA